MNSPGVTTTTDMAVPSGRPRVFLRQAQDRLPLRRTVTVRLGPNPAVSRDGCPARGASACAARGTAISVAIVATAIHEISGLGMIRKYEGFLAFWYLPVRAETFMSNLSRSLLNIEVGSREKTG